MLVPIQKNGHFQIFAGYKGDKRTFLISDIQIQCFGFKFLNNSSATFIQSQAKNSPKTNLKLKMIINAVFIKNVWLKSMYVLFSPDEFILEIETLTCVGNDKTAA